MVNNIMAEYIFILGNNAELSRAEIAAVFPEAEVLASGQDFLVAQLAELNCQSALNRLGGTIKIGQGLGREISVDKVEQKIMALAKSGKVNFGLSYYGVKPGNLGLAIKRRLKERGISCRLVVSRDRALSAVVVKKNKCLDFIVVPKWWGLTGAVQDFEAYGHRDFGRPKSDSRSGMIPPKLAKMMLNLSQTDFKEKILDPFCGSGTILAEAAALGYKNLIGSDLSLKAVSDSRDNLNWLLDELALSEVSVDISQSDARDLGQRFARHSIGAIVTEPYLGPPLTGREGPRRIRAISSELEDLYQAALGQFVKILKPNGRVVMVFPQWHLAGQTHQLEVKAVGFVRRDSGRLIYRRPRQIVWRQIRIFEKQ